MDYYENVVIQYLRANRSTFVNTDYCIQLNPGHNPDISGPHWYCDAVAIEGESKTVFLCEISYATHLVGLIKRLTRWHEHWEALLKALARDSSIAEIVAWPVRPWLFVQGALVPTLLKGLDTLGNSETRKFTPRITPLEMVQPWNYQSWNRTGEGPKLAIPEEMRV
jgi:hypothetical protein